jgi:hypothetical protein
MWQGSLRTVEAVYSSHKAPLPPVLVAQIAHGSFDIIGGDVGASVLRRGNSRSSNPTTWSA